MRLTLVIPLLLQTIPAEDFGTRLARAALTQVGVTRHYDPAYRRIGYPGGDVPLDRGVCTDVVIRAYRSLGADLQELVHRDMQRNWSRYPKLWGLRRPDPNIDHRRVPNLQVFFRRHGKALPVSSRASDYRPGDLVTWRLPSGLPHIGVVAERPSLPSRRPLIIHNIGAGVRVEDILFAYKVTGHLRFRPASRGAGGLPRRSFGSSAERACLQKLVPDFLGDVPF